jgi:hypothetical protein
MGEIQRTIYTLAIVRDEGQHVHLELLPSAADPGEHFFLALLRSRADAVDEFAHDRFARIREVAARVSKRVPRLKELELSGLCSTQRRLDADDVEENRHGVGDVCDCAVERIVRVRTVLLRSRMARQRCHRAVETV